MQMRPAPVPPGDAANVRVLLPSVPVHGRVRPLDEANPACFADRYPCDIYTFTLPHEGAIEVVLTWDGHPRALMAQLYWADGLIAHEAVAARTGPPRIWFVRGKMEAGGYRLRVVSLEPSLTIPYTVSVTY